MKKSGFTLIELMIVISVIGVLTAITMPKMSGQTDSAKVANVSGNLMNLRTALEMYNISNGEYPNLSSGIDEKFTSVYSRSELPSTPAFNGVSKSNEIHTFRDDTGGWLYSKEEGKIFANLSNGTYTGDKDKEIWQEEPEGLFREPVVPEVVNNSFEDIDVNIPKGKWGLINANKIKGWETNSPSNTIEVWRNGMEGVIAPDGEYFIELNSSGKYMASQTIKVEPGSEIEVSAFHRGRLSRDTASISLVDQDGNLINIKTDDGSEKTKYMMTTGKKWKEYKTSFIIPEGVTEVKVNLTPEKSYNSTVGNLIDNVQINVK